MEEGRIHNQNYGSIRSSSRAGFKDKRLKKLLKGTSLTPLGCQGEYKAPIYRLHQPNSKLQDKLATQMLNRLLMSLGIPEICIMKLETSACKMKHVFPFCTQLGSCSKRLRCPILASAHLSACTPRLRELPPCPSPSPA